MPAEQRAKAPQTDEQRFRRLIEAVTDYAIYMLDPDGTVAGWNPGAQRFKGYTPDEIMRAAIRIWLPAAAPRL